MKKQRFLMFTFFIAIIATTNYSCSKESGCTDSVAVNFNKDAEEDDGSCTYPADMLVGNWETTEIVDNNSVMFSTVISKSDNTSVLVSSTRNNPPVYALPTYTLTVDWTQKTLVWAGTTVSGVITDENYFEINYVFGWGATVYSVKQEFRRK